MSRTRYAIPPHPTTADGRPRRVGFELEFSGLRLADSAAALQQALGGETLRQTAATRVIAHPRWGEFTIELDWHYLKTQAGEDAGEDAAWVAGLTRVAEWLVPMEVVCPPLPLDALAELDPLVEALRAAGAQGTEESLIAAYGVHINTELPATDAATLLPYLRAFALLQWWLVASHEVDLARRASPYIDLWPEDYLRWLLEHDTATLDEIIASYLAHNPSRNRALDLLPLLAEIDPGQVRRAVDDPRIQPRPAFHYRLPNCHIERPDWTLAAAWNRWCVVERLAADNDALNTLAAELLAGDRPLLGLPRQAWVERLDAWLADHGSP